MALTRAILCLAVLAIGWSVCAAAPINPKQFDRLHALIKPSPSEDKWSEVPWQARLWEARRQAAEQGKPILIWAMDGNPLGCG